MKTVSNLHFKVWTKYAWLRKGDRSPQQPCASCLAHHSFWQREAPLLLRREREGGRRIVPCLDAQTSAKRRRRDRKNGAWILLCILCVARKHEKSLHARKHASQNTQLDATKLGEANGKDWTSEAAGQQSPFAFFSPGPFSGETFSWPASIKRKDYSDDMVCSQHRRNLTVSRGKTDKVPWNDSTRSQNTEPDHGGISHQLNHQKINFRRCGSVGPLCSFEQAALGLAWWDSPKSKVVSQGLWGFAASTTPFN